MNISDKNNKICPDWTVVKVHICNFILTATPAGTVLDDAGQLVAKDLMTQSE